jgi:type II secretory pathway component GspD/PulD (secretin)
VSSITSFRDLPNGISLPQISTRFVDTTVRVKSGETIAIGGLLREQDVNNLQKVPIIGDIPILGQLFRRSDKRKSRSEIVVFVTAKATEDGG